MRTCTNVPNHDIDNKHARSESDSQIEQLIVNNCESVSKKHITTCAHVLSRRLVSNEFVY